MIAVMGFGAEFFDPASTERYQMLLEHCYCLSRVNYMGQMINKCSGIEEQVSGIYLPLAMFHAPKLVGNIILSQGNILALFD